MAYRLSQCNVTDDITWPQKCSEAIRSAVLATAWLVVSCRHLQQTRLDVSYRSIHQMTPFQPRMCLLGEKNLNLIFNWFIRKNRQNTMGKILWGKFKDSLDCKNSRCMHGRVVVPCYGFRASANLMVFFKFTPGWSLLPWQWNVRQIWDSRQ